jgi:bacterial/archaeal transporter family-2 protein
MSTTGIAALLAFAAGLGGAVQIAVQGKLGERIGSLEALAVAAFLGAALVLVVVLLVRRSLTGVADGFTGPKWLLLGGVMGVFIVFSVTYAGPRIGVVATTALLIAAQFAVAAVIDRYGWFGVERIPLTWPRIVGIGLLFVGAALTLRR